MACKHTRVFSHYAKWWAFAMAQALIWFRKPRATAEHQVEAIMQNLPWRFEFGVSGFCLFFCHHLVTECQKLLLLLNFRDVFAWYGSARANLFFIFLKKTASCPLHWVESDRIAFLQKRSFLDGIQGLQVPLEQIFAICHLLIWDRRQSC